MYLLVIFLFFKIYIRLYFSIELVIKISNMSLIHRVLYSSQRAQKVHRTHDILKCILPMLLLLPYKT